jgi:hypothetical protein
MIHKLFPKEVTPFRVDFEGVAGAVLSDTLTAGEFRPGLRTPLTLENPVASFDLYAKATVTQYDLFRDVSVEDLRVETDGAGQAHLRGRLFNTGTQEATVPHLLVTYYDSAGSVVWVDDAYLEDAVRPQHALAFDVPITPASTVERLPVAAHLFADALPADVPDGRDWGERLPLVPDLGYAALRVSVNYFLGSGP